MADKKEAEEASCSEEEEGGVDSVIETAAEKANLSVLNVKSILHVGSHTLTHPLNHTSHTHTHTHSL